MYRLYTNLLAYSIVSLTILYLSILAIVYLSQDEQIFKPGESPASSILDCESFKEFKKKDIGGTLLYINKKSTDKAIIFYHGNSGNVCHRSEYIPVIDFDGYSTIFVEYKSFIDPNIKASFKSISKDIERTINYLDTAEYKEVVLVGRSLGTFFATEHAAQVQNGTSNIGKIVLISPPTSIYELAKEKFWYLPVKFLLKEDASNLANLEYVHIPTLIIAGGVDVTVFEKYSRKLFQNLNDGDHKYLFIPTGSHSDVAFFPRSVASLRDFIIEQ